MHHHIFSLIAISLTIISITVFRLSDGALPLISDNPSSIRLEILPLPKGNIKKVHDASSLSEIEVYETCPTPLNNVDFVIFLIYDVFGFHPHPFYYADKVAEITGLCVVIPDFFRGHAFPTKNFPPRNPKLLTNFINKNGSFESVVKPDLVHLINHYKSNWGTTRFGAFGFCWGGNAALRSVADDEISRHLQIAGAVHPSGIRLSEARKLSKGGKVILLPSKDEPNMLQFCQLINRRLGPGSCKHKRFSNLRHGFAGALGDWRNKRIKSGVDESIKLISSFFSTNLPTLMMI